MSIERDMKKAREAQAKVKADKIIADNKAQAGAGEGEGEGEAGDTLTETEIDPDKVEADADKELEKAGKEPKEPKAPVVVEETTTAAVIRLSTEKAELVVENEGNKASLAMAKSDVTIAQAKYEGAVSLAVSLNAVAVKFLAVMDVRLGNTKVDRSDLDASSVLAQSVTLQADYDKRFPDSAHSDTNLEEDKDTTTASPHFPIPPRNNFK